MKITTDAGPSFFIRTSYLHLISADQIIPGAEFLGDQASDILDAGLIFSAEHKATDYLARAEQSRQGLTRKLHSKGFEKKYIDQALDYLEEKNYLSDERYARAWLNTRQIGHYEGKSRLTAELAARGINREIITLVLDEFFLETSEKAQCIKALKKCRRLKKSEDKIIPYLMSKGFSYSLITICLKDEKDGYLAD